MAHLGHISAAKSQFGHRNIMRTEINEPKEGDYFTFKKNGEDWPIVICDEEIIQTFFSSSPRPKTARQPDGTWGRDYKIGGLLINDRRFPAIDLATLQFAWAPLRELEPIDIDMGRVIRKSTNNPLLAKAWSEYISQYKADKISVWKYLDHWKARLHAQRLDVPTGFKKEKMPATTKHGGLKRKGTPNFKYPPGYGNEALDDEESDDLFLPKEDTAGSKIKRESISSISDEEMDALYDDDRPYPSSSKSSKRSKLDLSGRFSMRCSTPLGGLATRVPSSVRHGTPFQSTNKTLDVNDPDIVSIYVDNPHKRFKVKRGGLDASPLLSKLIQHHPENGSYIMSPMLSSLDANDFRPIGEYIDRREYHPNVLDNGTVHVRLEGDLDPEILRHEVVRCGTVYQIAQMLEMPGLQDLAFQKLKALAPHHNALEILTVIDLLFEIGGPEVRRYLTQHVAEHYYNLFLAETERMVEVMSANEDLAKGVFRMLSGQDDEVKKEEVVKEEEELDGVKDEEKAEQSNGEAISDGATEEKCDQPRDEKPVTLANGEAGGHEDIANEGLVPGEKNMLKGQEKNVLANGEAGDHENMANEGLVQGEKNMFKGQDNIPLTNSEAGHYENMANEGLSQAEKDMLRMALGESDGKMEEDWVHLVQKQSDLFEAF